MPTANAPGLQQRLYISGQNFSRGSSTIQETPMRAEVAERMADSFTVIDRPYSFAGAPDVIEKFMWSLAVPHVNSTDYLPFSRLEGLPGFFDFCSWKPVSELFSGDGATVAFNLLRRVAVTVVPSAALPVNAATIYATVVTVGGVVKTNPTDYSFGTADTVGRTPLNFVVAPAVGLQNIIVDYTPLYYVRVDRPVRKFDLPHLEARTLDLVEI